MRRGPTRFRIFFLLCALVALVLCYRLAQLQIQDHEVWAKKRQQNYLGNEFLAAPRGRILDRDGRVLAEDRMSFELGIRYRFFRRQHPLGLVLHLDSLCRSLHAEEPASLLAHRIPDGLLVGPALRYQDDLPRFEAALDRWLELPSGRLRHKGIDLQKSLSSLRFYTFRLLSHVVEEDRADVYGKDYRISLRFHGWDQARDDESILQRFAPALTGLSGRRAEKELRRRLHLLLRAGHGHLHYLDELLARERIPPKASVFERLDFWNGKSAEFLQNWLKQLAKKRADRAAERQSESFSDLLARFFLGEDRTDAPDFEERLEKRYDLEDIPHPLFAGTSVSFDRVVALIVGRQEDYPGFRIHERYGRYYPQGTDETRLSGFGYRAQLLKSLVPLILGPVKTIGVKKKDPDAPPPELRLEPPDDGDLERVEFERYSTELLAWAFNKGILSLRKGEHGLERALDSILSGRGGLRSKVSDRRGREVGMPHMNEAQPGKDVQVTLDWELQTLAEQHLEKMARILRIGVYDDETRHNASAALTIIDAKTGDVLCMASYPRAVQTEKEGQETRSPLWLNRCADTPYRVGLIGSTIKPFMAVEAMTRFADPVSLVEECRGHNYQRGSGGRFSYQNRSFSVSCHAHLTVTSAQGMENALQESCNAFFCQIGRLLGREGIQAGLHRFGLATLPGEDPDPVLGLPMLRPGFSKGFWPIDRLGIGYGVKAAPLEIARAYAGLGTGRLPRLRIVERIDGVSLAPTSESLGIEPRILGRVRTGLERVVTRGTARGHAWLSRARVSGKTGTAIVWVPGPPGAHDAKRYRAWFSGWYPRSQAAYAFSCAIFEAHGGGGKAAARCMDEFLATLDQHPRLRRYIPGFARSRRIR